MRDILETLAAGELTPAAAESRRRGYASTGAGRFDAARERRSGIHRRRAGGPDCSRTRFGPGDTNSPVDTSNSDQEPADG